MLSSTRLIEAAATPLGAGACLVLIAASMAINAEFAYSRGVTEQQALVYAGAAAAADLIKCLAMIRGKQAFDAGDKLRTTAALVMVVLFTVNSLISAIGLIAESRSARAHEREIRNAALLDIGQRRKAAEEELGRRKTRTRGELEEMIATSLGRPVMVATRVRGILGQLTNECRKVDRFTAAACMEVGKLREELGGADRITQLNETLIQLRTEAKKLTDQGAGEEPDGQVRWLAKMLRRETAEMHLGLAILLALVIEAGSSLGLFVVIGHRGHGSGKVEEVAAAREAETEVPEMVPLSVEEYWLERLFPAVGQKESVANIVEDYGAYCEGAGVAAMEPHVFEEAFRNICTKIGLRISNGFAMGVRVGDDGTRKAA